VYAPVYALANRHQTEKDLRDRKSFSHIK
jgi:hypothetical protein